MNLGCQSIINLKKPMPGILELKRAGFEDIMLGISVHFPQADVDNGKIRGKAQEDQLAKYTPETIRERYAELVKRCKENSIRIGVVRMPNSVYVATEVEGYRAFLKRCAMESIVLCKEAECGCMIVAPLITGDSMEWETNRDFYLSLAPSAKEYGVTILLVNQCRNVGGHLVRGNCAEPFQANEWVDRLNEDFGEEVFGFCLDTGICSLCGNDIQQFITLLGRRIKTVILRDCDGYRGKALLPFSCAGDGTDWMGVIRGLREISFDGELIEDFSGTLKAFSPLLRPGIHKLAKEIILYIQWQIEIEKTLKQYTHVVLFGAGNMCRNYMKCYGEKYPPLFTCDNNPKLWGTRFCGLEVKNPGELLFLPQDCGIFICNIFYREIEEQLNEMGIKNVEYFNDEYMQAYYFDRSDSEPQAANSDYRYTG